MTDTKATLYCSFCGKSQYDVGKLIAGPTVFICNECIELCCSISIEAFEGPISDYVLPPIRIPVLVGAEELRTLIRHYAEASTHRVNADHLKVMSARMAVFARGLRDLALRQSKIPEGERQKDDAE